MTLGSDWDWYDSDEERAKKEREFQKLKRDNPNHPRVITSNRFRAHNPEYAEQMRQLLEKYPEDK
jgi:hypothetical protein